MAREVQMSLSSSNIFQWQHCFSVSEHGVRIGLITWEGTKPWKFTVHMRNESNTTMLNDLCRLIKFSWAGALSKHDMTFAVIITIIRHSFRKAEEASGCVFFVFTIHNEKQSYNLLNCANFGYCTENKISRSNEPVAILCYINWYIFNAILTSI